MIEILYFAKIKESVGIERESLDYDEELNSIDRLVGHLAARGEPWRQALQGCSKVMVAINQELVKGDAEYGDGDEIAFFPPMTGG